MQKIRKGFEKFQQFNTLLVSVVLLLMVGVVFLQTFCRFVIFQSLSWSEELSRYLFVVIIVLGMNLAISKHLFVRIEIIDNYLKGKAKMVMNVVRQLIMMFTNMIFVYSAYKLIIVGGYQTSPAMGMPMSILYALIFVGYILNVVAGFFDLYDSYMTDDQGRREE